MDIATLQQLTNDYGFDFVTFNNNLHNYPNKINLFNKYFIKVPSDIEEMSLDIIRLRLELIYSQIKDAVDFENTNTEELFSQIGNAISKSYAGKHDDIFTRELWVFHEYKNGHNRGLNARYFSKKYEPVMNEMLTNESIKKTHRNKLILEKTDIPDTNTSTEHIFPVNLVKKVLLKMFHIAKQKGFDNIKIKSDIHKVIELMFVICIIPKVEDNVLNSKETGLQSNMPNGFWDPSHEYYMDPWSRYKSVGIEVVEYNV